MAHFVTPFSYDSLGSLHAALNGFLPSEIRVREISAARPEFHARFSTLSKTYQYKIYNGPIMDPFQRHCVYHSSYNLNADAMREATKHFIGKHDFSAFVNVTRDNGSRDPVKDIFRFDVIEMVIIELHATIKNFGLPLFSLLIDIHLLIYSNSLKCFNFQKFNGVRLLCVSHDSYF